MTQNLFVYIALVLTVVVPPRPRHYLFTTEYFTFDSRGQFLQKQRITGDYAAAEPGDDVRWTHVTLAKGDTLTGGYGPEEPQRYMEGLTYPPSRERLLSPELFKSFPAPAAQAKNLMWDTLMFETFALDLSKIKAQSVYHVPIYAVPLASAGAFSGSDITLTWIGMVERHHKECALFGYEAFFNALDRDSTATKPAGRSDYWGQIWVSLATSEIESATLNEEVVGELNVVRRGTFERITP